MSSRLRLLDRLHWPSALATILATAAGCDRGDDSPTGPGAEAAPALATSAAAAAPLAFRQVDEGIQFTCGVTTGDRAYCWGANSVGQLGDGTTTDRATPTAVAGGLRFRHVSAGASHACGLSTDNRVYCWGWNLKGQIGDSTSTTRLTPVLVYGGRRYVQVRSGNNHTCALTTASVAYCWGMNLYGELGIGSATIKRRLIPVQVTGGLTFESLSGRNFHVCGRTAAGKAYCWGSNEDGRLGDGTTVNRSSPRAVSGGRLFLTLNAGGVHSCGVGTDKRVYCWGGNPNGELGDGTTTGHLTPKPVAGTLTFAGVSTGRNDHTCAVTSGGKAYCWGANARGQVGDGTTTGRLAPAPVAGGLSFGGVTAGYRNSCGVVSGSSAAYCWGLNDRGQLGDGTVTDRHAPTAVAGAY